MTALLRFFAMPLVALRRPLTLNLVLQLIAAALGLGGQVLVNRQDPLGFVFWMGANVALIWLQLRMRMFVLVVLYITYLGLCIHGLMSWGAR
jgi:hypothetical protein